MKVLIFTLFTGLFFSLASYSQPLEISISGGQTLSFIECAKIPINSDQEYLSSLHDVFGLADETSITGNYISAQLTLKPKKWIQCKSGLNYTQLGFKRYQYGTNGYMEIYRHHYIGIPLELELLPQKTFNFYGGLSCNYLLNEHDMFKSIDDFNLHHIDLTYQLGIGIRIWKLKFKAVTNKSLFPILSWKVEDRGKVNYYNNGFIFSLEIPVYTINKND